MRTTYIYELSKNGVPFYIGKTINPNLRIDNHKRKLGYDILFTLIDETIGNKLKWKLLETYWIEQYKQWGFILENKNSGGGGRSSIYTIDELQQNQRKSQEKWKQKNKEHILERDRQHYYSHKEQATQYYQDNKEVILERIKRYNKNNQEHLREYQKSWRGQNKESNREKQKHYYQLRKQNLAKQ